jgi:hypothetical protein
LPTSAPHGSVLAQLRHTALQATNSPATSRPRPGRAIRRRPVEMVSGLGVPGIYPSDGLVARHPLPSAGSLGSVPPRRRYYEVLRIPSTPPAALRFLRLAVSRLHSRFVPVAVGCTGRGPGVGHPVPPAGSLPRRWVGLPGSWGTSVNVPCSPTPAGPRAPGHCGAATRPSVKLKTSAPAGRIISGLNRTARSLAVYASQCRSPGHHARLAPGCWPALPDGAGYPQGPNERFPRSLPPFPSLSWRTNSLFDGCNCPRRSYFTQRALGN